jgi:hypothetical protein
MAFVCDLRVELVPGWCVCVDDDNATLKPGCMCVVEVRGCSARPLNVAAACHSVLVQTAVGGCCCIWACVRVQLVPGPCVCVSAVVLEGGGCPAGHVERWAAGIYICNMEYAIWNMQYGICNMEYGIYISEGT